MSISLVNDAHNKNANLAQSVSPLAVHGLTVSYNQTPAIFSVNMVVHPGTMTAIVGPNGAGKSTLLKAVLGVIKPLAGSVSILGKPLVKMRDKIAYMPQRASVDRDFPTRVIDVVMMGMYRNLGLLGRIRASHREQAIKCLNRVGMADFATRQIGQLSGGQQQRVFLARALAQDAEIYVLDEPLAGVDAATEKTIIAVLQELRDSGSTIVAVHHDLATVSDYFDDVVLLNKQVVAAGPIDDIFTEANLQTTYGGRLATARVDPESVAI